MLYWRKVRQGTKHGVQRIARAIHCLRVRLANPAEDRGHVQILQHHDQLFVMGCSAGFL